MELQEETGDAIDNFTYTGKAARLLTSQELVSACSSLSSVGNSSIGELDGSNWLFENLGRYDGTSGASGYWLETPRSDITNLIWYVESSNRDVINNTANESTRLGIRPVITIKTIDLEV